MKKSEPLIKLEWVTLDAVRYVGISFFIRHIYMGAPWGPREIKYGIPRYVPTLPTYLPTLGMYVEHLR